jgi:hypothetical protein
LYLSSRCLVAENSKADRLFDKRGSRPDWQSTG